MADPPPFDPDQYIADKTKPFDPDAYIAAKEAPQMTQARAALLGHLSGASANFADEVYGLSKASGLPDWMGGFRAPVGAARMLYGQATTPNPEFMKTYEDATAERRAEMKAAETQFPKTYLAGQVGGSMVVPGGNAARVLTLPQRMVQGAAYGSIYGGLSGAGEGENLDERLKGAALGTVAGGITGGVAPPIVEGVLTGGKILAAPVISAVRGAWNPENEALRLAANTLASDARADPTARTRLTPTEFGSNVAQGGPAVLGDLGGEGTRGLMRAASNISPEARERFNATLDPRFETQANRVSDWLRQTMHYPNPTAQEAALTQVGRTTNAAGYDRAYAAGAGNVGSTELERLASSDAVAAAMKTAASKAKDEAVLGGYGAMNPRVTFTPDGRVIFQKSPSGMPLFPDLQFWDLTRRELSASAKQAARAGNDEEARRFSGFAKRLNEELDKLVPEYGEARTGAAHFFGSENALEAGSDYFGQARRFGTAPARQAFQDMTPLEQQLFRDAYASRLINSVEAPGSRRNVLTAVPHLSGSPALEAELGLGLGPANARALGGVRRVETVMDRARQATQGNSTTARQLAEMGLFGTAGGITAYNLYNQSPSQLGVAGTIAALTAGGRHVNRNVMQHVAEILTSQEPTRIMRDRITQQTMRTPAALAGAVRQAVGSGITRSQASEQRSALARRLLERSIVGAHPGTLLTK